MCTRPMFLEGLGVVLTTCIELVQWAGVALALISMVAQLTMAEIVVLQMRKRLLKVPYSLSWLSRNCC